MVSPAVLLGTGDLSLTMSQLAIYPIWNCQDQISVAPEERAKTPSVPCRRRQRPLHDSEDTDIQLGHIYLPTNYLTRSDRHSRSVVDILLRRASLSGTSTHIDKQPRSDPEYGWLHKNSATKQPQIATPASPATSTYCTLVPAAALTVLAAA